MEKITPNAHHPWEPNIIVFACNWCSYAGADLAGVSRLQYPPNVKINRIMCTGRISSSIILNTFQLGADGVLICGCHIGDCHYLSGNKKAEKVVETTFKLVDALGIGKDRLRLEWISASEGPKFAATMTEFTQQIRKQGPNLLNRIERVASKEEIDLKEILKKAKTYHCYSCTQCTGGCPISRTRTIYNPRKQMRRLLYGMEDKVLNDLELWSCLTCGVCNSRCPHEVDLVEFIKSTRAKAKSKDICGVNAHDGLLQKITQIQIQTDKVNRSNWLTKDLKTSKNGEYLYFVGCLPYYQAIFSENGSNLISIAQDTLKILNKIGIEPIVLDNEKCCGHDMLYSGDKEGFNKLAKYNLDLIKKSKAKKVIFSCPECNLAFNKDYQDNFGELDFETIHITQLLNDKLPNNNIKLKEIKEQITYQDSCRLGRFSKVYEEPRNVLRMIPGLNLVEMQKNREEAMCCGSTGWTNCFNCKKRLQIDRLNDASSTGAKTLVTSCPKCQIHLNCAQDNEEEKIEIKDITNLVAEAIS